MKKLPFISPFSLLLALLLVVTACSKNSVSETDVSDIVVKEPGALNEQFLAIDEYVPGFGGMFYDDSGVLNVHFIDAATASQVTKDKLLDALKAVFGDDVLSYVLATLPSTTPEDLEDATAKFILGRYRWADLYRWYIEITELFSFSQVVFKDIDERINRLTVGVDDMSVLPELTARLDELSVPRGAVKFEEAEATVPLTH